MQPNTKQGFTLFEVMIASAIATFLIVSVYSALLVFMNMVITTRNHNEAEALAMDRIWTVFNQDYTAIRNLTPNPTVATVPTTSPLFAMGGTLRTGVIVESNACEILVAVDWVPMRLSGQVAGARETLTMRRSSTRR